MICGVCQNRGLVKLNWADAPDDFGICLCAVGLSLRVNRNHTHGGVAPLWRVWCAREQVDPSRMFLLEDVLTPDELRAAGLAPPPADVVSRETALLSAGKKAKR